MTLRTKTLAVISVAFICSLAVVYAVSSALLMQPFLRLDEDAARKNAERARDALLGEIDTLGAMAGDYATWDETYAFVEDRSPWYVTRNLADDAFTNLGVEAMVFVNASGRVVFSKCVDPEEEADDRLPAELLGHIAPGKLLAAHADASSKVAGIVMLPHGPHLVASRPIVTSDAGGPVRGAVIMARRLDLGLLDEMAQVTHLSLAVRRMDDGTLDREVRAAVLAADRSHEVTALRQRSGAMAGYLALDDLYGRPVLMLKAEGTGAIYQLGKVSLRYFLIALMLIGLLAGLVGLFLLEKLVLLPLARLSSRVRGIGTSGDLSARVAIAGRDELSHVAEAINGMLSALERSQRELRESEERYRAFVEQSSEGVWRLEMEAPLPISLTEDTQVEHILRHGIIAEANDLMAKMHGHEQAERIIGARASDVFDGAAAGEGRIRSFIRGGYRITDAETEQTGSDGTTRCFVNHLVGIVEDGALVRAWGIQRDITGRRRAEAQLRMQISAINAATDQIIIADSEGDVEFVNAAFVRETGYTADEMVGRSIQLLESGQHDRGFYDELWNAIREGKTWKGEIISRRKDGGIFTADTIITPVKDGSGAVQHFIAIKRDITAKKVYQEQLDHLAHHDSLTGLPNRLLLHERLMDRLAQARLSGRLLAVMFLDLDRFKFINDTLGHSIGDALLKLVSSRLTRLLRGADIIARTGGDEFTVVLSGISSSSEAARVAERILHALSSPFVLEGHDLFITASIGISLYPTDGTDVETLAKHAGAAMYRAKEQGRNNHQFFTRALSDAALERLTLERNLRRALERGEFRIHYQPRMDIGLQRMLGAEALLRWRQSDGRLMSPAQFIPVAEETGLIVPITEWVLRTACARGKLWQSADSPPLTVEVNVSAYQLHRHDLIGAIGQVLNETGLDPRCLGLEITESALMRNPELAIRALHKLKAMGVRLLIDNFGTGHSSLSHLKRLPVDAVKIDRSFVSNVTLNPDDAAIASAIIAMAHSLKLRVIAEGVETMAQLDFLRGVGCDEVQGYLIAPPLPAEELQQRFHARPLAATPS